MENKTIYASLSSSVNYILILWCARCACIFRAGMSVIEIQGETRRTYGAENDISPGYFLMSIEFSSIRACTVSRLQA